MIEMQDMRQKGVTVLAVSIDVDADIYHRFIKQNEVNFLTVRAPNRRTVLCMARSADRDLHRPRRRGSA